MNRSGSSPCDDDVSRGLVEGGLVCNSDNGNSESSLGVEE